MAEFSHKGDWIRGKNKAKGANKIVFNTIMKEMKQYQKTNDSLRYIQLTNYGKVSLL
jgi:hypothetical protein